MRQRNRETFGYLAIQEVTGAELLLMSHFDLYNCALLVCPVAYVICRLEAGVKIFDPSNLALIFQAHNVNTRVLLEVFSEFCLCPVMPS